MNLDATILSYLRPPSRSHMNMSPSHLKLGHAGLCQKWPSYLFIFKYLVWLLGCSQALRPQNLAVSQLSSPDSICERNPGPSVNACPHHQVRSSPRGPDPPGRLSTFTVSSGPSSVPGTLGVDCPWALLPGCWSGAVRCWQEAGCFRHLWQWKQKKALLP